MEQTIGKRIAQNRKRLGLTQDALAEKLGVTAQAVSKWENDQSCPDITTLPKLAEIFGITTDALLGVQEPAYEAEVVTTAAESEEEPKSNWEFSWDAGRHGTLTMAVLVLLVGGLSLANALLSWNVGFWSILWPSALLVFGFSSLLRKFSFFGFGCGLFGGYFLLENLGLLHLDLGSELIWPVIVVLFGISLLVDALRKPKKARFHITRNGIKYGDGKKETKNSFSTEGQSFECSLSFGEDTYLVELPVLEEGDISCSFGEMTVDLSSCNAVAPDCSIDATCSFGELTLLVPKRFRVQQDASTAFAGIHIYGQHDDNPQGVILLDASVSFGEIQIRYI